MIAQLFFALAMCLLAGAILYIVHMPTQEDVNWWDNPNNPSNQEHESGL